MSAFIVGRDTIDTIITAAVPHLPVVSAAMRRAAADVLGRHLWAWNLRAVATRYPGDTSGQRPGPLDFRDSDASDYTWTERRADPEDVCDAIDTLDDQCSESDDWQASDERDLLDTLRHCCAEDAAKLAAKVWEARQAMPHLDYDTKQTAAEVRKALRQTFPGTKFSVRMDRGTAYGWMHVAWTDGPTDAAVRGVCDRFESERFDGRDDSYHRVEPTLYMVDGVPTEIRYSCCGINTSRQLSDDARAWALAQYDADPSRWLTRYPNPSDYEKAWIVCKETDLTRAPA